MKVLGVIGSPRREKGLSHRVVSEVLSGARAAGAETDALYLIDGDPEYCVHCGHGCFQQGGCLQEPGATERSQIVSEADALVVCAPVYCWQPSGLMATFFDKIRLTSGPWRSGEEHGRWGVGIGVAGGTGTGVFTALQSIYAWLCLWKYRPLDPVPVTRFNLERVLGEAASLGRALSERPKQPYAGTWENMLTYDRLPALRYSRVDEFRWLAEQIAEGLAERGGQDAQVARVRGLLGEGRARAETGDAEGEAKAYIKAYGLAAETW